MSRDSEDTLGHGRETGSVKEERKDHPTDGGERGEKKPEEQGSVGFWHS